MLKPPTVKAARAFRMNLLRIHESHQAVRRLTRLAARCQGWYTRAVYEVTGKFVITPDEQKTHVKAITKRFQKLRDEQEDGSHWNRYYECRAEEEALWDLTKVWKMDVPAETGFAAQRESMVMGVWTAIEICLGDLWKEVQVKNQQDFAKPEGAYLRIVDAADLSRRYTPKKPYTPKKLKHASFASLLGIRGAYSLAFSKDFAQLDEALADLRFEALAAVRNVLVHSAGEKDQKWKENSENVPQLQAWTSSSSKHVRVDGPQTNKLIADAIEATVSVLKAVNVWAITHK